MRGTTVLPSQRSTRFSAAFLFASFGLDAGGVDVPQITLHQRHTSISYPLASVTELSSAVTGPKGNKGDKGDVGGSMWDEVGW